MAVSSKLVMHAESPVFRKHIGEPVLRMNYGQKVCSPALINFGNFRTLQNTTACLERSVLKLDCLLSVCEIWLGVSIPAEALFWFTDSERGLHICHPHFREE